MRLVKACRWLQNRVARDVWNTGTPGKVFFDVRLEMEFARAERVRNARAFRASHPEVDPADFERFLDLTD